MLSLLPLSGSTQGAHASRAAMAPQDYHVVPLPGGVCPKVGVSSLSINLQMTRNPSKDGNREQYPYGVTSPNPSWERNKMFKTQWEAVCGWYQLPYGEKWLRWGSGGLKQGKNKRDVWVRWEKASRNHKDINSVIRIRIVLDCYHNNTIISSTIIFQQRLRSLVKIKVWKLLI